MGKRALVVGLGDVGISHALAYAHSRLEGLAPRDINLSMPLPSDL